MNDLKLKNISEIIVNSIINKIISFSISSSVKQKTEKEIPFNCYKYIKETLNNILSTYYIIYDRDEERKESIFNINKNEKSFFQSDIENIQKNIIIKEEDNNNNDINFYQKKGNETELLFKNYFFNNSYKGENDWEIMKEPNSLNLDRYSSTLITYKPLNKNINEDKFKNNHEEIVEVDENDENYSRTIQNNTNRSQNDKGKEKDKIKTKFQKRKKSFSTKIDNKQKWKENLSQLDFDLEPVEKKETLENIEIKKLREELEKNKKIKDYEKKIVKEEKEKLMNIQKINEENNRKYIGKVINKDHNGEIIFIKKIKPENFKLDFIFGKIKLKTIINNENKKKKSPKNELNKYIEQKMQEIPEEKKIENSKKIAKKGSVKSLPKLKDNLSMATIEVQDKYDEKRAMSLTRRFPIITSGSNFNLMNMEIGVSIKEDEKYKTGGMDFLSKFKKFSLKAYNKKLKEAETANNFKKNIEIIEDQKSKTIDNNNIYSSNYTIGNSTSYGNINFNSTQTIPNNLINRNMNINNKMYSTNSSSIFNQYLKNVNSSNFKEINHRNNNSVNPFIQLTMGSSSLIGSLEKLNLISNEEEKNHKNRKNIFRKGKNNLKKERKYILDDINMFTKNLMKNKKVEIKGDEKLNIISGIRNPGKPNIKEIIQEIGLKGKIRRNRSKLLIPIKSSYIDTENFFKH